MISFKYAALQMEFACSIYYELSMAIFFRVNKYKCTKRQFRFRAIAPRLTLYVSMDGSSYNAIYLVSNTSKELMQKLCKMPGFYEMIANGNSNGAVENVSIYSSWSMHSKYSGSGSNIFNDSSKNFIYLAGPSGVHVNVTDEVLNNEVKDGSLYALEVQNGKVVMKLINKNE